MKSNEIIYVICGTIFQQMVTPSRHNVLYLLNMYHRSDEEDSISRDRFSSFVISHCLQIGNDNKWGACRA